MNYLNVNQFNESVTFNSPITGQHWGGGFKAFRLFTPLAVLSPIPAVFYLNDFRVLCILRHWMTLAVPAVAQTKEPEMCSGGDHLHL